MKNIIIRNEKTTDYRAVEEMTRDAFWNLYAPGCVEHYLESVIRNHPDFIPELDLVLEIDGRIVGLVMYTKAQLIAEDGQVKPIVTFGPLCIAPEYQRQRLGKKLLEESFKRVEKLGYDTIVIFGMPENYVSRGFVSCLKKQVHLEDGTYPAAMMVKELKSDSLVGHDWIYKESPAMEVDLSLVDEFDQGFSPRKKFWQVSQEEFYIISHSTVK